MRRGPRGADVQFGESALHRVVLLIDATTDEPFLRSVLSELWQRMDPDSPNVSDGSAQVAMMDLACGYPAAVRRLMQLGDEVCACAEP